MPTKRDAKLEADFQADLIKRIKGLFPHCIVLKNDSGYQQGIPDLTVLWMGKWAFLEVKPYEGAVEQPNQRWFIEQAQEMAFGAFIFPENEEEVLDALCTAFRAGRKARLPQSQ